MSLQDSLSNQRVTQQAVVWENSNLEKELKNQNHRLSKQLVEAGEREAELKRSMQSLREKVNRERSNLEDHFTYIDSLKGEISRTLTSFKWKRTRRIKSFKPVLGRNLSFLLLAMRWAHIEGNSFNLILIILRTSASLLTQFMKKMKTWRNMMKTHL